MTVKDLYDVTSESFIFINDGGTMIEFYGQDEYIDRKVTHIKATSYPMYISVLEVEIEEI